MGLFKLAGMGALLAAAALGSGLPGAHAAQSREGRVVSAVRVTGHLATPPARGVGPDNTVTNPNCGEAAMYIVDNGDHTMSVQYEWYSDIGNISYVRASGSWSSTNGRKGTLSAPNPVTGDNQDTEDRIQGPVMSGSGRVTGVIPTNNMSFTNTQGVVCLFPSLNDTTTIY